MDEKENYHEDSSRVHNGDGPKHERSEGDGRQRWIDQHCGREICFTSQTELRQLPVLLEMVVSNPWLVETANKLEKALDKMEHTEARVQTNAGK